ncbi:MAG: TolC family protein [Bacteroidales bacterium]
MKQNMTVIIGLFGGRPDLLRRKGGHNFRLRRNLVIQAFFPLAMILLLIAGQDIRGQNLNGYLEEAAENNPELIAKFKEYQSALQRVPQAGSLADPQLSFGYYLRPMEFPMGKQHADLTLMQMFPWFGTLGSRKDEASRMARVRYEAFRHAKNRLYFDVKTVWYELYELEKEKDIMETNLDLLEKLEDLAMTRFQSSSSNTSQSPAGGSSAMSSMGAGSMQGGGSGNGNGMSDVLRARMEINEMENMLAELNDARILLKTRFNRLLNRPAQMEVAVNDTLEIQPLTGTEQMLLDNIIEENPGIRMLDEEAAAYEIRQRTAVLEGRPSFGAGLNYMIFSAPSNGEVAMGGRNMVMPMVTMSLPIYRNKYKAREREAELLRESTLYRQENLVNEFSVQLSESLKNISDAERRAALNKRQAGLADQTMDILITEYSVGRIRFEELLRLQEQLLDYQLGLIRAVADHNRLIARLEMLSASEIYGTTDENSIHIE